ncbi:MAG: glycosyltransferase family 39 protein [Anaerolineae bacterium]
MNAESEIEELAPWLVGFVTLVGGGLRVLLLAQKGMWLDETVSVWLASHTVPNMLHWIATLDHHPPLYYLLLHYWIALQGDMAFSVRLLSALLGAGTIPVIYLIGKRMSGAVVGLAAAILLAFSPFNIIFAQETRMYAFLTFNAAVAIYALVRLLTDSRATSPIGSQFWEYVHVWRTQGPVEPDPKGQFSYRIETRNRTGWRGWISRHRWLPIQAIETDLAWIAFIIFSAATLLSHSAAVLFALATNAFVLGLMLVRRLRGSGSQPGLQAPSVRNWAESQIAIFLLWSPWLPVFVRQVNAVYHEFWLPQPRWEAAIGVAASFLDTSLPDQGSETMLLWIPYALMLCLGLVHFRRRVSRFLFLAVLFVVPFFGELIVSLRRPVFLDRTLLWTTIPLLLMLAAGIAQLRFRFLIIAVVGILVANNLLSAADYYRFMQKEDWSTAAGYVAKFAEEDDLVLFNDTFGQIPFDYYFRTWEDLYSIQVEKKGLPVDILDSGIVEPKMTPDDIPRLMSLISGRERVWLVYSHDWYTDPMGLIPKALGSAMTLVRHRDFYGGQVQLYTAP